MDSKKPVKRKRRSRHAAKIKRSLEQRRQAGLRVSGKIPYGYSLGPDGKTLVPNDAEQDVVAEIDFQVACFHRFYEIAASLNEQGYKTRSGGQWHPTTVRTVHATSEKYQDVFGREPLIAAHKRRQQREDEKQKSRPSFLDLIPFPGDSEMYDDLDDDDPEKIANEAAWEDFLIEHEQHRREYLRQFKR